MVRMFECLKVSAKGNDSGFEALRRQHQHCHQQCRTKVCEMRVTVAKLIERIGPLLLFGFANMLQETLGQKTTLQQWAEQLSIENRNEHLPSSESVHEPE